MALPRPTAMVRVLLSLVLASLLVAWLVSTKLPRAVQPSRPALEAPRPDVAQQPQPVLPEQGKLYIWRDSRGSTHIESQAPPADVEARVVPFQRKPKPAPAVAAEETHSPPPHAWSSRHPLSVYTPEGFDTLMEQVDSTARRLEERNRRVKELSKQL